MFTVRFWRGIENVEVGGRYMHDFDTAEEAFDAADALSIAAWKKGCREVDINNDFYNLLPPQEE